MARAYVRDVLTYGDEGTLIALANAVGELYTDAAATVAATDAYSASSGGSPITSVTTDATGSWEVFFETAKTFYVKWLDNSDTAYPIGVPATLKSWTPFVRRHEAIDTLDDATLTNLLLSGTFAARPAAGTAGRIYTASWTGTQIVRRYYDTGSAWISLDTPFGKFNPLDYGADPTGATDSRTAVVACLTAASTALDTGLPYGSGNLYGEIEWTCGQYTIATAITLPQDVPLKMTAVGGTNADYQWGQRVYIVFTAGGFVLDTAQSNALQWDGLCIIGAPAVFADRGSGPGQMANCELRSVTAGQPAMQIRNSFWGEFDHCTFRAPNTSTPCVLIESDDQYTGGFEGWLNRFTNCRSESGSDAIQWDIGGLHGTVVGIATVIESWDTENIAANAALLHIRNTHATENTTFHDVSVRNCTHNDNAGDADIVKLTTVGTGSLTVGSVQIENSEYGSSGYHVRHVETGGGAAHADKILVRGYSAARVLLGASPGGYGYLTQVSGSGWDYRGDRTTAVGYRARVDGDAQDRVWIDARGWLHRGLGAATPSLLFADGSGSPEGVVTAGIGSIYQRTDGSAILGAYLKATGSGNTGWVQILGFTPVAANADTSGATLVDLETEVNQLKASLRTLGLMAP